MSEGVDEILKLELIRNGLKELREQVILFPDKSRELSLVLTKIEEAILWFRQIEKDIF